MKVWFAIAVLLITAACDSSKSSQQATDDALEAVLHYKKLKAEGKLPTPEEQAELRRQLRERTDRISSELQARIKAVASECLESHPNNPEAYKGCLQEREPLVFGDGKARDDCIMAGKTNCR
jgi:hypothetical protein